MEGRLKIGVDFISAIASPVRFARALSRSVGIGMTKCVEKGMRC